MRRNPALAVLAGIAVLLLATPIPTLAEYRVEKNLRLDPGGIFVLDSGEGSVTITGGSDSGARIVITSNRDDLEDLFEFHFDESPGMARVTARKKYTFGWSRNIRLHFEVRVPAETSVDIKTGGGSVDIRNLRRGADLKTSGGSIKVSELSANLMAHTSGGSIHLRRISGNAKVDTSGGGIEADSLGGSLDARTSGGSIRLQDVKGDLSVHTSGGSIRIEEAQGRVDAKSSGGSVEVRFALGNARGGEVETSGGGVRIGLDPSVNLNLDASTTWGSVKTDLPLQVSGTISGSHIQGSLGSGGETLRVHSSGGPVRIEAR